jgi:hypothetical protein
MIQHPRHLKLDINTGALTPISISFWGKYKPFRDTDDKG